MKHKNTQPLYIFNRENPQNSEQQNGPRSGLDYIALGVPDQYKFEILLQNFRQLPKESCVVRIEQVIGSMNVSKYVPISDYWMGTKPP